MQKLFHKGGRAEVASGKGGELSVLGQRAEDQPSPGKEQQSAPQGVQRKDCLKKDCLNHVLTVAFIRPLKERKMRRWGDHTGAGEEVLLGFY